MQIMFTVQIIAVSNKVLINLNKNHRWKPTVIEKIKGETAWIIINRTIFSKKNIIQTAHLQFIP